MAIRDLGPLDWRVSIVDKVGRPTPEFQRKWEAQRNNNALIGTITFGSGTPTGMPETGAEYVDTSTDPAILYIGQDGAWLRIGVFEFIQLSDTPGTYSGASSKILRVNSGATAVEFDSLSSILDGLGSAQGDVLYRGASGWTVLTPGTSGQFLKTNGASADPVWDTVGGGGGYGYELFGSVPTGASFTPHNQMSSSLIQGVKSLVVKWIVGGSNNLETYVVAAPSTPYDVYTRIAFNAPSAAGHQVGICVRNSSSGKVLAWGFNSGGVITLQQWTTETTFNSAVFNNKWGSGSGFGWLRVNNDGTTLTFYYAMDGETWVTVGTQALATFITAGDQIGFYIDPATDAGAAWIGSFGTTAPS